MSGAAPAPPPAPDAGAAREGLHLRSATGRWVLAASVLGSGMAFLDATVVNVALPHIGRDLGAGLGGLQWTVNAYTLALAALLLLSGSLGDRLGRRRVFVAGIVWFAVASLACALAPTVEVLIAARIAQGVGGALLTPASLALMQASFRPEDRSAAIGAWTGLTGVAGALGPLLGGWLVDVGSWRLIFLINLPLAAVVIWAALRHVPESRDPGAAGRPLDVRGAALAALALAGLTHALGEAAAGRGSVHAAVAGALGAGAAVGFLVHEARTPAPLVPLGLFRDRVFSAANAVTLVVYAALSAAIFLLPLQLQQVLDYSALQAGMSLAPVTVLMLVLSPSAGRLCGRVGPRLPLTLGPLVAAAGFALLARVGAGDDYLRDVLPGTVVFGCGLSLTVAPLTAAVLGAAPSERVGVASAVNTTLARAAGLLAVALVPVLAGIGDDDYLDPSSFSDGFRAGMWITAGLCASGGALAGLTLPPRPPRSARGVPGPEVPASLASP